MDSRSEWNDRAITQLDGRVENLERDVDSLRDEHDALAALPAEVASTRRDITRIDKRLDKPNGQMRWSTFLLTVMGTIVVPLIGVIITGYFMLRAAGL